MRFVLFTILIIYSYYAKSQEDSIQIKTDRPGFSEYPKVIPKGYFQIEAGFSFESETVNPNDKLQLISWNNTLLKYGLTTRMELRLGHSFQSERLHETATSSDLIWISYPGPAVVGTKIDLLKESELIPETAVLAEYGFNTLDTDLFQANSYFRVQLSSKYQLNPEWYLMANIGYDERINNFGRIRFTLNTGYTVNDQLSLYAELYGFRSEFLTPTNFFDGGISYLINPKFQLDIHAGFDLAQRVNNVEDYKQSFIALGLGYLFKIQK